MATNFVRYYSLKRVETSKMTAPQVTAYLEENSRRLKNVVSRDMSGRIMWEITRANLKSLLVRRAALEDAFGLDSLERLLALADKRLRKLQLDIYKNKAEARLTEADLTHLETKALGIVEAKKA